MNLQQENATMREALRVTAENVANVALKYKAKRDSMLGILLGTDGAKVYFSDYFTFLN